MRHWHRHWFSVVSRLLWSGLLWVSLIAAVPSSTFASVGDFWTAPAPFPHSGHLPAAETWPLPGESPYHYRPFPSSDGIGKVYMGREIAEMMGHQGAGWLERPNRATVEQPHKFLQALEIHPDDVIADIGAGTGYISFRLAALVPDGQVFAVDIQPEMLRMLTDNQLRRRIENVEPILGTETSPNLPPESIDWAVMVDAYHEFAYPQEMMAEIITALKPGGKVVLVEYKAENPLVLIKPLHKMSRRQVIKEMQAVGLVWQESKPGLPQQHVLVFGKDARELGAWKDGEMG